MEKQHLYIFDTTLRDGEQSPGASMTKDEKIRIAKQLEKLKVDVMEAGFAAASPGDFDAIHSIAKIIKDSTVCSLARANENDINRSGEAIKPANSGRIHTFIATSPIHMQMKLKMSPDQVLEQAVKAIGWARKFTDNVEFSAEDAGRSEIDFLCRIFEAVIKAELDGISELILDFGGLEYISSAGLRTLLVAQKKLSAQGGSLIVRGCNESIREVFEITGFSDILTIE